MAIAFLNGNIFIGDGEILEKGSVLIDGDRIVKITNQDNIINQDNEKINIQGYTLFPGFIDCHVHFCLDGSVDPVSSLLKENRYITAFKAAKFAKDTLMTGITTVRDMGGIDYIDLVVRDAIKNGLILGPRMLASGRLICMTGGHGWQIGGREADGQDEVRRAVREQIKKGCDIIKLMATGGVITPGVDPGSSQLTEDELHAGIEEAHKAGRKTAAHAQGEKGILNALKAGIDSIEHGFFLNEEAADLMNKKNIPLIPTLKPILDVMNNAGKEGIPDFVIEKVNQIKPKMINSLKMAIETGLTIGMGTDAGTPFNFHGENLNEIVFLSKHGLSNSKALQSATLIAAKILGLDNIIGSIKEDKMADIIIIKGNPLENIKILNDRDSIVFIMKSGNIVKNCITANR